MTDEDKEKLVIWGPEEGQWRLLKKNLEEKITNDEFSLKLNKHMLEHTNEQLKKWITKNRRNKK